MIFKTQLWCSNSFKQGLICVNEGEDEYKKYVKLCSAEDRPSSDW